MSERQPRVSIGLPVYNGQRFLAQAAASLLAQTYTDFELVLCDNASTDDTESICRRLAAEDRRVRYHRNDRNIGAAPNFNRAFDLSTGRYFKWAAHDDVYAPTYLEKCVATLDSDPTTVLCHGRTVVIDEDGREVCPPKAADSAQGCNGHAQANGSPTANGGREPALVWEDLYDVPRRLDSPQPQQRFRDVLLSTRRCFEIFGLIRREALAKTGGHGSFYGSDKVILSALSLMGRLVEVPEPLFFRRHHAGASGSIKSVRARETWIGARVRGWWVFPRVKCLRGYCRSVVEAQLGWRERTGCFAAVARYLLQGHRWVAVMREPW